MSFQITNLTMATCTRFNFLILPITFPVSPASAVSRSQSKYDTNYGVPR